VSTDNRPATTDARRDSSTTGGRGSAEASVAAMARAHAEKARRNADRYADMRTMVITCAVLGGAVAVAATIQAVIVLGIQTAGLGEPAPLGWDLGRRIFINLLTVITTLLLVSQLRIETRRPIPAAGLVLVAGVSVAALRAVMQIAVGIYSQHDVLPALADAALAGTMISLIIAFAVYVTRSQQRTRRAERTSHLAAAQSSQALVTLLRTQARARHKLSADTHAALRDRFARVVRDLDDIIADTDGLVHLRLRSVRTELTDVAVSGKKGLALFSYPEALEHGLVPAVRAFISAIPKPVSVRLRISNPAEVQAATGSGPLEVDRRAILLHTVVEGTLDALEFCHAQRIDVEIGLAAGMVRLAVTDEATGDAGHQIAPGIEDLRRQVSAIGGRLESELTPSGGCRLVVFAPAITAAS
jgi:signal transduction histidine kinase